MDFFLSFKTFYKVFDTGKSIFSSKRHDYDFIMSYLPVHCTGAGYIE